MANAAELHALIAAWAAPLSTAEATARLAERDVPAAVVRDTATAVRDPRALARGETVQLAHPELGPVDELYGSGFPVRFSAARAGYETPSPRLGEHNEFVLGGLLGYPPRPHRGAPRRRRYLRRPDARHRGRSACVLVARQQNVLLTPPLARNEYQAT